MARTGTYVAWLKEEDLYCVKRFIENYFEQLIKVGKTINSKAMQLEVSLYNELFNNKRTNDSVRLKFHNIKHLAFKFIEENGNPYNIKIFEGMSKYSKQCLSAWSTQIKDCSENINEWLKK